MDPLLYAQHQPLEDALSGVYLGNFSDLAAITGAGGASRRRPIASTAKPTMMGRRQVTIRILRQRVRTPRPPGSNWDPAPCLFASFPSKGRRFVPEKSRGGAFPRHFGGETPAIEAWQICCTEARSMDSPREAH